MSDRGSAGGGPKRLAVQGPANRLVRGVLRTPVLSRLVGRYLVTLHVVGRRSGRRMTIPMAYVPHDGALLLGSGFRWGTNLRTGEPLEVRYKGRRRTADVRVLTDEPGVTAHYAVIARRNPGFARLNGIGVGRDGVPDVDDLRSAWEAGARVFLLTLR